MYSWKVAHSFKEGMSGDTVVWFQEDFEAVRDGKKGHNAHPEVVSHLHIVKQTIEHPDEVRQDRGHTNRQCFYSRFSGDSVYKNQHMKVVIEQTWYGKLRVLTAYFTQNINSGEETIWTKK